MELGITLLLIAIVMAALLTIDGYAVLLERKVAAWVQDRYGPNRVGFDLNQPLLRKLTGGFHFWGLGQPLADGLKFLLKEQVIPSHVNKVLYVIAPSIAVITTLFAFAVVPFGPTQTAKNASVFPFVIAHDVDVGIVFIFAVTSLTVYAVILGGWSSNNKYSFLGGLRSSAQLVSYEIPMGLSVLGVVLLTGSLNLEKILGRQADGGLLTWNVWYQPLAFLIFMTSAMAESNRMPFDLPECEQELVGGYHTEYSAMKLVLFFIGEYTHVTTTSFLLAILFFGGWHFPYIAEPESAYFGAAAVKVAVLAFKVFCFIFFIMLIRWTIPRFRFDQLMGLAWKVLIPLGILNVVCAMFVKQYGMSPWWLLPASLLLFVGAGFIGLIMPSSNAQRGTRTGAPEAMRGY